MGGVDDTHAVDICLSDAGVGGALEDYHRRQRDSPLPPGLTELLDQLARLRLAGPATTRWAWTR